MTPRLFPIAPAFLLLAALLPFGASAALATPSVVVSPSPEALARTVARQEIEYLRRQYARATDLIGLNTPEGIAEGRAIYRRIFAADAKIAATEGGKTGFSATGPDAWVEVAAKALAVFATTQHMIGTQLVEIHSLPDADGKGGEASMTSYLQAWHDDPGRLVDIFIGTYHDTVRYTPGVGWQIYAMELERVAGQVTER
ncbi:nuclear transport factor 2 family protein [Parahaliea aestuarii]|uniref:Nuclear transport factor 2 family protein n=1 Tax=Parahaliea aestuarii TaxID=1852021 RepID=A0A5C9A4S2_9GAMM|nr:nuclear transport factor 2 family protein [Parahaliea aestuarii]TXS95069.1 nuclear transport factor 2 family protein [Parahaliea aestuarii]